MVWVRLKGMMLSTILVGLVGQMPFLPKEMVRLPNGSGLALSDPEVVCGGESFFPRWSADGRYLVVTHQITDLESLLAGKPAPPTVELISWSAKGTSVIARVNGLGESLQTLFPGPEPVALIGKTVMLHSGPERNQPTYRVSVSRIDLRTGTARVLVQNDTAPYLGFFQRNHVRGGAAFSFPAKEGGKDTTLAFVVDANATKAVRVDGGTPLLGADGDWYVGKQGDAFRVDQANGSTSVKANYKPYRSKPDEGVIRTMDGDGQVAIANRKEPISASWLVSPYVSDRQFALIGAATGDAVLSPAGDAVAYIQGGVTLIRRLVPIPKARLEELVLASERRRAIETARQMGVALSQYAHDNDDNFPTPDNLGSKLSRYVKDLMGFNYTFPGGSSTNLENPTKTELGYVLGPGGRAVVYADSSVRWIRGP